MTWASSGIRDNLGVMTVLMAISMSMAAQTTPTTQLAGKRPATQPALVGPPGWGPVTEGVVAFLAANQPQWPVGKTPQFLASVANIGSRQDLVICQAQDVCEIELDGRWHQWVGSSDVKSSHLLPSQQYDDIAIALDDHWSPLDGGGRLALTPGRHTLRVAFMPMTTNFMPPGIRAVTNPVTFVVVAPTTTPAK